MECDKVFESIIKSIHSPKMSSLLQFVAEIWPLFSPTIPIQKLILRWVLTEGSKAKLEGFVQRGLDLKMSIFQLQFGVSSSSWGIGHFSLCTFQILSNHVISQTQIL